MHKQSVAVGDNKLRTKLAGPLLNPNANVTPNVVERKLGNSPSGKATNWWDSDYQLPAAGKSERATENGETEYAQPCATESAPSQRCNSFCTSAKPSSQCSGHMTREDA
jgi:hypothetical protein